MWHTVQTEAGLPVVSTEGADKINVCYQGRLHTKEIGSYRKPGYLQLILPARHATKAWRREEQRGGVPGQQHRPLPPSLGQPRNDNQRRRKE